MTITTLIIIVGISYGIDFMIGATIMATGKKEPPQ